MKKKKQPGGQHVQHSYPVLVTRRGQGRRLPPTPCKPSTLQLKPSNINFPKLNASPTHVSQPLWIPSRPSVWTKTNEFFFHFSFIHKLIIQRHTVFIRYHIHGIFYEKIKTIIIHVKEMHVNVSKIHIEAHIAILPGVVSVLFFCLKEEYLNLRMPMIQLKLIL